MTRRSIFATLLAPLLARFAPKAKAEYLSDTALTLRRLGMCEFVELPCKRINDLLVINSKLFVLTDEGMFEIFADGSSVRIGTPHHV